MTFERDVSTRMNRRLSEKMAGAKIPRLLCSRFQITPELLALVGAAYFALLCNTRFWSVMLERMRPEGLALVEMLGLTFTLLTGIHIILLLPVASRLLIKPVLSILFVVNAMVIYFMDRFGVFIDVSMIRNVVQTDMAESAELLSWRMLPYLFGYAILPGVVLFRTRLRESSLGSGLRRKALLLALGLAAIGAAGLISFKDYSSFFRNNHEARYLITPGNYIVSATRAGLSQRRIPKNRIPVGTDAVLAEGWRANERPVFVVLVLGETARASSFSLNGYERQTNPRLGSIPGLVNFRGVAACGTSTADSLPCMFSPFTHASSESRRAREYESLLDVVGRSGLDAVWIDNNSGCKGVCDGVASETIDPASSSGLCTSGECFDAVFLERLEARLSEGSSTFAVLHQKGSHGPAYHRRYPEEFARFQPVCESDDFDDCSQEEIRNAYDNSILYTDWVLAEMIDRLERASDRYDTAFLYVSDHGESLGEHGFYLHGLPYAIAPETQTRVPMVFWMSDSFAQRFGIDRDRLELIASSGHVSHDHLFHSVLGMLEVRTDVYDRTLDVFHQDRASIVTSQQQPRDRIGEGS